MARTDLEYADRHAFYMAYEQICGYCHRPLEFNDFDIDHIIPDSTASRLISLMRSNESEIR
jgi:hypothetical protein